MKKIVIISLIIFIIPSCKNIQNDITKGPINTLNYLKDSLGMFDIVKEFKVRGELMDQDLVVKYYSIPEEDFFDAISKNTNSIRVFNRQVKYNENLKSPLVKRTLFTLKIGDEENFIYLKDVNKDSKNHAKNYFVEDVIGDFIVLKRFEFEDAETFLINKNTGNSDIKLYGISLCTDSKDSLIFHSENFFVTPDDKNSISICKINNSIDTLFCGNPHWFTYFSFFDKYSSSIYYIHTIYEDNRMMSTYAKMEINNVLCP